MAIAFWVGEGDGHALEQLLDRDQGGPLQVLVDQLLGDLLHRRLAALRRHLFHRIRQGEGEGEVLLVLGTQLGLEHLDQAHAHVDLELECHGDVGGATAQDRDRGPGPRNHARGGGDGSSGC
ncbi:hypothetical protein [Streptomyces sediminimaris]|uniref:hypothetical protein n=1 Tax=Streptomyces sediminimaris TaxID=3383721 RepID=UPI003999DF2B